MKSREQKLKITLAVILGASLAVGVFYPLVNDLLGIPTEVTIRYGSTVNSGLVHPNDPGFPTFGEGLLYRFGLWSLFLAAPVYLIPPVMNLFPRIGLWIAAVISIFLVSFYARNFPRKKRFLYIYLISGQIACFAAPLFVWHNLYSQSIFPEL